MSQTPGNPHPAGADSTIDGVELGRILGLSKSRISRLATAGVLTRDARGRFDLASSVQSYIGFLKAGAASATVATARAELVAEQKRRLKLANDRAEGEVVDTASVQEGFNMFAVTTVMHLEAIPGRSAAVLAGESDPGRVRSILQAEVRQIRTALADAIKRHAAAMFEGDEAGWRRVTPPESLTEDPQADER